MNVFAAEQLDDDVSELASDEVGEFSVELDFFSGPMDLLLHLVKQQEVAIEDVKMTDIAEQYLAIVSKANYLDLDKATEYLVIAATLIAIKSQRILPNEQSDSELEGLEGELDENDFLEELRERLKQYEVTKRRAQTFRNMAQHGVHTFTRQDKSALLPSPEEVGEGGDAVALGSFFLKLMHRIGETAQTLRVKLEPVSVVSLMMKTIDLLKLNDERSQNGSFLGLIKKFVRTEKGHSENTVDIKGGQQRGVIIGSFIAVLELVKRGVLGAEQGSAKEDISLVLRFEEPGEEMHSEFDEDSEVNDPVLEMDAYREEQKAPEEVTKETEKKEVNRG